MPAVQKGKVLVTGANGFLALWVVKSLLDAGYSVRGTVRSPSKVAELHDIFKEHADRLEVVVVPDFTKEGAFDDAVKGVDAIEHTASPAQFHMTDPREYIEPAVSGTVGILKSALAHANDTVKRVVITSSIAAVVSTEDVPVGTVVSEANWNEHSVRDVEQKGGAAGPGAMYRASKTLAEKAAWAFLDEHKGEAGFDLVVLNPSYIFGPVLQHVDRPEDLNVSAKEWWSAVVGGAKTLEQLTTTPGWTWIDVRDIGLAHLLAIQKEEAGGERIIISAENYRWQDWVNVARKFRPSLPEGNTQYDPTKTQWRVRYDTSKSVRVLGLKYRSKEETAADILEQYKQKGWIQ